jgi:dolichol kinase
MALLGLAFLAVLGAGEALARRAGLPPELTRKLDHALAGPVALAVPFVLDAAWQVLALASAFLVFLSMTSLAGRLGSVHGIARRSVGAYLYPVAIAATWFATQGHPERYAVAILALSLADAAGGLVGERWGRRSYLSWGQPKSWEGSLATLVVTAVISVPVLLAGGMAPAGACLAAAMVALVVALVEGSLPYGLDNLGVPLAAVAALASLDSPLFAELLLAGAVAGFGVALAFPGALARARSRPRRRALPELR